jgi:hypothetical protein
VRSIKQKGSQQSATTIITQWSPDSTTILPESAYITLTSTNTTLYIAHSFYYA